jgi:hypothetical protein
MLCVRHSDFGSIPSSCLMHYCERGVKQGQLPPAPLSRSGSIYPNHVAWFLSRLPRSGSSSGCNPASP